MLDYLVLLSVSFYALALEKKIWQGSRFTFFVLKAPAMAPQPQPQLKKCTPGGLGPDPVLGIGAVEVGGSATQRSQCVHLAHSTVILDKPL